MALPQTTQDRIKIEANKIYWQTHKVSTGRDPYAIGLTMFEVAQVPLIEALTEKEIRYQELQAQAQRMADALEWIKERVRHHPESSWHDIARMMELKAIETLDEIQDGKGKGNKKLHSGNKHQWQDDWDIDEQGELNEETD